MVVTLIQLLILNGCPYLSGVWSGVDLRTDTTKACVLKGDWTMSSNFVNPCRLNSQHNWGPLCDHVMRKKDLHFDNELDIDMNSKFRRKMATGMNWIC